MLRTAPDWPERLITICWPRTHRGDRASRSRRSPSTIHDAGSFERRRLLGVAAPIGRQHRRLGAALEQLRGEVDADEAKPANHQHARVDRRLPRPSARRSGRADARPIGSDRCDSIVNRSRSCWRIHRSSPYIPPDISRRCSASPSGARRDRQQRGGQRAAAACAARRATADRRW